jgi:putative serine protease PepD
MTMTETPQTTPYGPPTSPDGYGSADETAAWPLSPPPTPPPPSIPGGYDVPPSSPTPPTKGTGSNMKALVAVGIAVVMILGGMAAAAATLLCCEPAPPKATVFDPPPVDPPTEPSGQPLEVDEIAARLRPSTVLVKTDKASGTGIVFNADGEIYTNRHVIEGARTVGIIAAGERTVRPATLVGVAKDTDVALLRVADTKGLEPAAAARVDTVKPGHKVVAIGYPKSTVVGLEQSVTTGIVSSLRTERGYGKVIQTDAAINPGNSGGPLVDMYGRVIGLNTYGIPDTEGMGFAIAIDEAQDRVDQLRAGTPALPDRPTSPPASGTAACPGFLGVSVDDASPVGARVTRVTTGSPAEEIGLRPGDVIVSIDRRPSTNSSTFSATMRTTRPGQTIELAIVRTGKAMTGTATLATPTGC